MPGKLTKQGLRESLDAAMEFGYKAHERGDNLDKARDEIRPHIEALVANSDNLPTEILRIDFGAPKDRKLTRGLRP